VTAKVLPFPMDRVRKSKAVPSLADIFGVEAPKEEAQTREKKFVMSKVNGVQIHSAVYFDVAGRMGCLPSDAVGSVFLCSDYRARWLRFAPGTGASR